MPVFQSGHVEVDQQLNSGTTAFMGQALFVCRFEQSQSEVPVNFDGTTDHAVRKPVEFHLRALRVLRGCCQFVEL